MATYLNSGANKFGEAVASEIAGVGGDNSKVFEYTIGGVDFTLEDTYTKGNSWVYAITFVLA